MIQILQQPHLTAQSASSRPLLSSQREVVRFVALAAVIVVLVLRITVLQHNEQFLTIRQKAFEAKEIKCTLPSQLEGAASSQQPRNNSMSLPINEMLHNNDTTNLKGDFVHVENRDGSTLPTPLEKEAAFHPTQNTTSQLSFDSNNDTLTGAFIHVEKTGGSTLSLLLRNGCHSFLPKPCRQVEHESRASQLIGSYYHVPDFPKLPNQTHSFYVITLRDPFDRTVSSFAWHHPRNDAAQGRNSSAAYLQIRLKAYKCFPTLERFAGFLGDNPNEFEYTYPPNSLPNYPHCPTFAKAALSGKVRPLQALYFGFSKLQQLLPPRDNGAMILATRMEHLDEDWRSVNAALGDDAQSQQSTTTLSHERKVQPTKLPVSRYLSQEGRERLCQALHREYRAYFQFLKDAINLTKEDLQNSVAHAKSNCPNLQLPLLV